MQTQFSFGSDRKNIDRIAEKVLELYTLLFGTNNYH